MEKQFAELYQKIGQKIMEMIPVEWSEIYYLGWVTRDKMYSGSLFYYKDKATQRYIYSNDIMKLYDITKAEFMIEWQNLYQAMRELYKCFIDNGQEAWEEVTIHILENGAFDVNYSYDAISNNSTISGFDREMLWAYRTFSYIPPAGSFNRERLNEYLEENGESTI